MKENGDITELSWLVNNFEKNMRTRMLNLAQSAKSTAIVELENEALNLRRKVSKILSQHHTTAVSFHLWGIAERAMNLINKYQYVKRNDIPMEWDLIAQYAKYAYSKRYR